ncbi:MAG: glycosyltransferase family 2 protein [Acidimicrobiales bacterium]|nr:glycosyltransferase family 2 protein [Acidimicrobiales bacterium]
MTPPVHELPLVRIVVLNHDGGALVLRALAHVMALDWPPDRLDVVVIDNASTDGSPAEIRALFPSVTLIERPTNEGFGANNHGLTDLPANTIAVLLNPDTAVAPDLLHTLIPSLLEAPANVGAACPRIVFDRPFSEYPIAPAAGHEIVVSAVFDGDADITGSCHVVGDAYRLPTRRGGHEWRCGPGSVLRAPDDASDVRVAVNARRTHQALLGAATVDVGRTIQTVELSPSATGITVVQNDGSAIDPDGTGRNLNYWADAAHAPLPAAPPDAWCGAAVALRAEYLEAVGLLAPEFFLYYEDTDLSWRGTRAGWRYLFVPEAVVAHRHSAITGQGSALTDTLQTRNRLLMLARNAPLGTLARAAIRAELSALNQFRRAIGNRRPGAWPDFSLAIRRLRGLAGAARLLPWALRSRRAISRTSTGAG